jgi:hypothetical protein
MKKYRWIILIPSAALLMSGCVTSAGKTLSGVKSYVESLSEAQTTSIQEVIPERTIIQRKQLPSHCQFVLAAIVEQMRYHDRAVPEVVFDPAGRHALRDPQLDYNQFELFHIDIGKLTYPKSTKNRSVAELDGIFHFRDVVGRMTSAAFFSQYEIKRSGAIRVLRSNVSTITPTLPRVAAFFVPVDAMRRLQGQLKSFLDFFAAAAAYAVPMRPTAAEIAEKEKLDKLSTWEKMKSGEVQVATEAEYVILVFCMERLAPEADFTVKVMKTDSVVGPSLAHPIYFNDAGWRFAMLGGKAKLDSLMDRFFVFALYQPDPSIFEKPIMLGRFDSVKNYTRGSQTKPAGRIQAPTGGPLSSGQVFLNPGNKGDAKTIQRRMAELGYYHMKVDGAFGRGSRQALQAFRMEAGLGNDGTWDLKTQMRLFQGSGL